MVKIYGYGVDVSSFQPNAVTGDWYKKLGADFAVVKTSENISYQNPYCAKQIAGAKAANISVHGYHFAKFVDDSNKAVAEANYAVRTATNMGLPKEAILVCDYEIRGGTSVTNTQAIIAFLKTISANGYKPVLYTGPSFKALLDSNAIYNATGATLWVAAYPLGTKPANTPSFNYFPSMSDNTSAWQFTDNWKGLGVDGSVDITGIWTSQQRPSTVPTNTVEKVLPVAVDGIAGVGTVKALQKYLGSTIDGIISGQTDYSKQFVPGFTTVQIGNGGSRMVSKLQSTLGVKSDGIIGPDTVKALQGKLGVPADGYAGATTVKALQTRLNGWKLW